MRKAACWLLIVSMALLLALSAGATEPALDFTDSAGIRNVHAVQMLVDLGLISGDESGSFRPDAPITRAETAKLIACLYTDAPESAGWGVFADTTESWAKDYIAYCAEQGIVGGSGGYFRPQDNVTAQELAKMLLVTLGFEPTRYSGALWSANVNTDAEENGIYTGFSGRYNAPVTRDDACLLIYNALQCPAIEGVDPDGTVRYALDGLLNRKTFLEVRYDAVRYTAVLTGNEHADLSSGQSLSAGVTKLDGHREFSVSSELGLVGHLVDVYVRDGQVLGVPSVALGERSVTICDAARLEKICAGNGLTFTPETHYYKDYAETTASVLSSLSDSAVIIVIDHDVDGWIDVVLVLSSCREDVVTQTEPLRLENATTAERFSASFVPLAGERVLRYALGRTNYVLAN